MAAVRQQRDQLFQVIGRLQPLVIDTFRSFDKMDSVALSGSCKANKQSIASSPENRVRCFISVYYLIDCCFFSLFRQAFRQIARSLQRYGFGGIYSVVGRTGQFQLNTRGKSIER